MSYHRLLTALLAAVTVPIATAAAFGQFGLQQGQGQEPRPRIWVGGDRGFGRMRREPAKWADRANFDGQYNFCRVFYTSDRGENGGMGWWTDYPGADNNFSVRLAELTYVNVKMKPDGQPDTSCFASPTRCSTAVPCCTWRTSAPSASAMKRSRACATTC